MANKKQTAVEWLIHELGEYFPHEVGRIELVVNKAKAMEKEQHGETWDYAMKNYDERGGVFARAWSDFDDYYKETYES